MRKKNIEQNFLKMLFLFSIISLFKIVRKPPMKDWLIIFLFKGYISSIMDHLLTKRGYIKYPTKLFESFDVSFLYDYLLFPITCVFYNQVTKTSKKPMIFIKVLLFSIPMTIVEHLLEKNTTLVTFRRGWNSFHSFLSVTSTFLIVRGFIAMVRKADNTPVAENEAKGDPL
ncbi:CBO0543 family protein [Metabacillus halosaccharovorans]|uniref:CBO0543 family protein n=1 Tax=Metabacillus halosaccharovorans TaxID=930124 RepID=UPI001C1FFF3E|nr:CBO0543 family protein [Metabacillus halosaccharovorans]